LKQFIIGKLVFTAFRRRHHCRICGQIFCHKCAAAIVSGARFGYNSEMRVCNFCLKLIDDFKPENNSTDANDFLIESNDRQSDSQARVRSASISFPLPTQSSSLSVRNITSVLPSYQIYQESFIILTYRRQQIFCEKPRSN
jgi:hypothetical protein